MWMEQTGALSHDGQRQGSWWTLKQVQGDEGRGRDCGFMTATHAKENLRSWLYRLRPFRQPWTLRALCAAALAIGAVRRSATPNRLRWDPLTVPEAPTDFRRRHLLTYCRQWRCGYSERDDRAPLCRKRSRCGTACSSDADGELLIVPQHREMLTIVTELGVLEPRVLYRDRPDSARRAFPRRSARGAGAGLCLRELRRGVQAARSRTDRLERPGQSARFRNAVAAFEDVTKPRPR
jgi:hypothetical protein